MAEYEYWWVKPKEEYRYIGKSTPRKDAVDKVTGKAMYTVDMKLPHMLYGKVLRSPHPHANIKTIDTSKAEALAGVRAVLTYENLPENMKMWRIGNPGHLPVLSNKVRCVGDAVALVAAETLETAVEALELIEVEYETLPAVYEAKEAMEPGAPVLYDEFPTNELPPICPLMGSKALGGGVTYGDVETGLMEADVVEEGENAYEGAPSIHVPEPPAAIAYWEEPTKLTVWFQGNKVSLNAFTTAGTTEFEVHVRFIVADGVGGDFGTRGPYTTNVFFAAALAKVTGRPVKVISTMSEDLICYVKRHRSRVQGKIGMKMDGTVTAVAADWFYDTGHYSEITQGQVAVGSGEAQLAVATCGNWDLKAHTVVTNRFASGIVRGFGGQEFKSAFWPLAALAMEKANIDPLEFFKKNYSKPGHGYYWRDGLWYVNAGIDYTKAMEEGATVFGWTEKWKGWLQPTAVNGTKRRGVGVGIHGNADSKEDVSEAFVQLNADGTVLLYSMQGESGMGQRTCMPKRVAEVFNMPIERVHMSPPDTDANPFDFGGAGSRQTYCTGFAVTKAAEEAKQKLFERAALMLAVTPEELETQDGFVYLKANPEVRLPWVAILTDPVWGPFTISGFGRYVPVYDQPNFFINFCEVEVDVETGKVDLVKIVGATDAGMIIDPACAEGQVHAALGTAGAYTATYEEQVFDKSVGRYLATNMVDYKWGPTFLDLPESEAAITETPVPGSAFGAVGFGEITTAASPSAILMAVCNAIGTRIFEYPLTPDKILKALGKVT